MGTLNKPLKIIWSLMRGFIFGSVSGILSIYNISQSEVFWRPFLVFSIFASAFIALKKPTEAGKMGPWFFYLILSWPAVVFLGGSFTLMFGIGTVMLIIGYWRSFRPMNSNLIIRSAAIMILVGLSFDVFRPLTKLIGDIGNQYFIENVVQPLAGGMAILILIWQILMFTWVSLQVFMVENDVPVQTE